MKTHSLPKANKAFKEVLKEIRQGAYTQHTAGIADSRAQFNLVVLPKQFATQFSRFCQKNKTPCPLVWQSEPGQSVSERLAGMDICRDAPMYRIFENGLCTQEVSDISQFWQDDFVAFLIGCSFTFEQPILEAGIALLHIKENKNVAMYRSNIDLHSVDPFQGKMVVSMRWIETAFVDKVVEITSAFPDYHGAPVFIGEPGALQAPEIGIGDLTKPDFGEFVLPDKVENYQPLFWGCGVTPQVVLEEAKLSFAITHKPGCMLVADISHTDILNQNF